MRMSLVVPTLFAVCFRAVTNRRFCFESVCEVNLKLVVNYSNLWNIGSGLELYNHMTSQMSCLVLCARKEGCLGCVYDGAKKQCKTNATPGLSNRHETVIGATFWRKIMPKRNNTDGRTYLGCFKDSRRNRTMKDISNILFELLQQSDMTISMCANRCKLRYSTVIGLESSSECYCSKGIPSMKLRVPDSECNHTCTLNAMEICGGHLRLSIYKINT